MRVAARAAQGGNWRHRSSPSPAVGRDALLRQPDARRQPAVLPEHVDRDAATRIPVAADTQELRLDQRDYLLADGDGAVLMEAADVAEAAAIELERLRFQEPVARHVVDN